MAFISKEDGLKVVALLVVALFIFETFAYQPGKAAETLPETVQNTTGQSVSGAAIVAATVLSYGTELAVVNIDEKAQAAIDGMKERKIVQYSSKTPDGILVLNLGRKTNMSEVAALFEGSNATIGAQARLRMPAIINFSTSTGQVSAAFQDISLDMTPDVPIGQNITVRINANIRNGEVLTYSAFPVAIKMQFKAKAKVLGYTPQNLAIFSVKWENRNFNDSAVGEAFRQAYPNGTVSIIRNSSVLVDMGDANFSQAYVLRKEAGRLDINESFIDRRRLEDDLLSAGVDTQSYFPTTALVFEVEGESANFSFVDALVKYSEFNNYRNATLELPEEVVAENNRTYSVKGRTLTALISEVPVGSEPELSFIGSAFAKEISKAELAE